MAEAGTPKAELSATGARENGDAAGAVDRFVVSVYKIVQSTLISHIVRLDAVFGAAPGRSCYPSSSAMPSHQESRQRRQQERLHREFLTAVSELLRLIVLREKTRLLREKGAPDAPSDATIREAMRPLVERIEATQQNSTDSTLPTTGVGGRGPSGARAISSAC